MQGISDIIKQIHITLSHMWRVNVLKCNNFQKYLLKNKVVDKHSGNAQQNES